MRKKLENWWNYHRSIVTGTILFLLLVLYIAVSFGKNEKKQILFGEIINNAVDYKITKAMEMDILHEISDNESAEKVIVDTALTMDISSLKNTEISGSDTQASAATITAYVYAHELDFMVCEKEIFEYYKSLNAFADLKGLFSEEEYDKIKISALADGFEGCGIDITDTSFVKKYGIRLKNPVLAVLNGSEHKENSIKMIQWILEL